MKLKNFVETIKNTGIDSNGKEKMLQDQYEDKKSHDMKIREVKKEVSWSDDFFYTFKPKTTILPTNIY